MASKKKEAKVEEKVEKEVPTTSAFDPSLPEKKQRWAR